MTNRSSIVYPRRPARLLLAVGLLVWFSLTAGSSAAQARLLARRDTCLRVLYQAMQSADGFFVRVHAAEALLAHHQPRHIDSLFSQYRQNPPQLLGATRVLARLQANAPARRRVYIDQILRLFLRADSAKQQLAALESLGKLGYYQPLGAIRKQAEAGETAMKAMARWVLANSGNATDEARLAQLLGSPDPLAYRYAAYAFRYQKTIRPATRARLAACARRIALADPERVYVLSALWVHTRGSQAASVKARLLPYQTGKTGERYELAEALNRRGNAVDLFLLNNLMHDTSQDVRVAAANAILAIDSRPE